MKKISTEVLLVEALLRENEALKQGLWDCGIAAGMDTDGQKTPDAVIAGMGLEGFIRLMVNEVEELRQDYTLAIRGI